MGEALAKEGSIVQSAQQMSLLSLFWDIRGLEQFFFAHSTC